MATKDMLDRFTFRARIRRCPEILRSHALAANARLRFLDQPFSNRSVQAAPVVKSDPLDEAGEHFLG